MNEDTGYFLDEQCVIGHKVEESNVNVFAKGIKPCINHCIGIVLIYVVGN